MFLVLRSSPVADRAERRIRYGTGKRLFREGTSPGPLQLVESKTSGTGVLILTYVPAPPATG